MQEIEQHSAPLELSLRAILIAVGLTVILAMSNAYLALRLGMLTSASIPAAIISMGILRFFKNATVLENNAIQTAASAGEAVAGGIVYTIPALILIHYWHGFDYWTNFLIAAIGGILGVFFSIPLRRFLVHDKALPFPEGRAIAEVLKSSSAKTGVQDIIWGGGIGAIFELFQVGFKLIANGWQVWFFAKRTLFVAGIGFSATMIGAGYLVGIEMALSILLGALLAWGIGVPWASHTFSTLINHMPASEAGPLLWGTELRYLGIGAMLCAGIWTFLRLFKPLIKSIQSSLRSYHLQNGQGALPRTEQDISFPIILGGISIVSAILFIFFQWLLPLGEIGLDGEFGPTVVFMAVMYVVLVGFLFSVITAYFSGMVGVSASPGSSIIIAGILFAAWLLLMAINHVLPMPLTESQLQAAEAIVIIIGSMVTGIAAIANDNTQDLKVGFLVGATPWRQQLMLLLGVVVSALVIPPVMQLLFEVYGIGGVMPRAGMDPSQALPAPTAAILAALSGAVFQHSLPGKMMFIGAVLILVVVFISYILRTKQRLNLSILGVAIGMYLPLSSSTPLFIGGMVSWMVQRALSKRAVSTEKKARSKQRGTMIACGLVAGSALMDVLLSIPFSMMRSAEALALVGKDFELFALLFGVLSVLGLSIWIWQRVVKEDKAC